MRWGKCFKWPRPIKHLQDVLSSSRTTNNLMLKEEEGMERKEKEGQKKEDGKRS